MLYFFVSLVYVAAFYLPLPAILAPYSDLLEFSPRWLVFLPMVFYLFRRLRLKQYLFLLAVTIMNLILVMDFNLGYQLEKTPETSSVKIASYNLGGVKDYEKLISWFEQAQLDVLFLQETNSTALTVALEDYSLHSHCAGGLCLVSRYPVSYINALSRRPFGGWGNFAASYQLVIAEQSYELINVHLNTPRNGLNSIKHHKLDGIDEFLRHYKKRETESLMASMLLDPASVNAVVAGDFNLTEQGVLYRKYWHHWQNNFGVAGFGFGYTKSTRLFGARIDHILTSSGIKVWSSHIAENLGGDHNPVVSQVTLQH